MAKVDVVVPCYNYGRFLTDCVGSVLGQSIGDVRVLVIDDASSDDSVEVANRMAALDRRVEVIAHARNQGHIKTYNEGIEWASGDYFLLLSADDLLVPGALERAAAVMDRNPAIGLTYGESAMWFRDRPPPLVEPMSRWGWSEQDLLTDLCRTASNFIPTPTAIARTSVQKAVGGYRAALHHSGDLEMWLRFAAHAGVARIDAVQAIYRKHSTAMSNSYVAEMLLDYQQRKAAFDSFFESCGDRLPDLSALRKQTSHSLADQSFQSGIECLRRGRIASGLALLRWAVNLDRRLRHCPPVWRLLRFPGPEGRKRMLSTARTTAAQLLGTTLRRRGASERRRPGDGIENASPRVPDRQGWGL